VKTKEIELLEALSAKLLADAHSLEGQAIALADAMRFQSLVLTVVDPKLGPDTIELVRQHDVFLKSLAATFIEQAKRAREVRERFEELLAKKKGGAT
jgi:hypothetical protein